MPINIHHGPPGSYKTSGAIQDDFIREASKGRVCITNVRGLDDGDKVAELLELPESFELVHIDTSKEAGRDRLARFYDWAPPGAYFLVDECNTIWPKELTGAKLRDIYKYSGPQADIENQKRPTDLLEAFEMHRHFNWDFTFTTPNYSKVNAAIKECAEVAFRHVNRATIGLRGSYWEIMHHADNAGRAQGDQLQYLVKRIKRTTFGLYQSTTTGEVSDSSAGRNIFLQPRTFVFLLVVIAMAVYLGKHDHVLTYFQTAQASEAPARAPDQAAGVSPVPGSVVVASANGGPRLPGNTKLTSVKPSKDAVASLVDQGKVYYRGQFVDHVFALDMGGGYVDVPWRILKAHGFRLYVLARCVVELVKDDVHHLVTCEPDQDEGNRLINLDALKG